MYHESTKGALIRQTTLCSFGLLKGLIVDVPECIMKILQSIAGVSGQVHDCGIDLLMQSLDDIILLKIVPMKFQPLLSCPAHLRLLGVGVP